MGTQGLPVGRLGPSWLMGHHRPPWAPKSCFGLASLPVAPCRGLVWPGPVLPALPWCGPAKTTGHLRRPAVAAPPLLLLLLDQAKARREGQAQARPSQGKAQQASQPSQGLFGRACNSMENLIGECFVWILAI